MSNHTKVIDDGGNYLKKKKKKQDKTKRKGEFLISAPVSGGILLTQQM